MDLWTWALVMAGPLGGYALGRRDARDAASLSVARVRVMIATMRATNDADVVRVADAIEVVIDGRTS